MSLWKTIHPLDDRAHFSMGRRIPASPGVYAIFKREKLVYIGQSENLASRVNIHILAMDSSTAYSRFNADYSDSAVCGIGLEGVKVKFKVCKRSGEWMSLEYRLIKRLKPLYNRQFVKKAKPVKDKKKIEANRRLWNSSPTPMQRFNELLRERQQAKKDSAA